MELRQLEYLGAVVRTGSVTRAADVMHVAQPSISKQIKLLERELGVALFQRVGRRIAPTEAGLLLAECAGRVLDEIRETSDALTRLASSQEGTLLLCATETVTDNVLPAALAAFRRDRPRVHVTVEMLGTDDAIPRVLAGEVDLGLVVLPVADSRLEVTPLFTEEIVLTAAPGHPWAERGSLPLDGALAAPGLLLSMPGIGLRGQLEREAQALGLRLESGLDLRSQHALLSLVARAAGVAFAPLTSARRHPEPVAILSLQPPLTRSIGWITRRGRRPSPATAAFLETLQETLRGFDDLTLA